MKKTITLFLLLANQVFGEDVFRRSMDRVPSMDPAMASSIYAGRAIQLVYEPLYEFDYAARPYRLVPCLAESMPEVAEDGRVYTIRLAKDVRFQDDACFENGKGRAIAAEDVVYSFARVADKNMASPGAWLTADILRTKALAQDVVQIELKKPSHQFIWYLAQAYLAIVPHEAVEHYGADFASHPVGTGPYRLASWRRNHQMRFERRADWRGWSRLSPGKPFDAVEYNVVDDVSTQWLCFLNSELDFLGEISRDNWDAVIDAQGGLSNSLRDRGVSLFSIPALEVAYVGINMEDPVLGKNKALRQALNCAFDSPAWIRFLNGRVTAADGPVPPGTEGRLEETFPWSFDLQRAKELMAKAGYPGGIDPATGRRLELTIDLGRTSQDIRESTELMVSFYAKIGIALHANYHNWPAFLELVAEKRSQMFRIGWVGDYPDAQNFLQLFHSKNISPGPNRCNFSNPEFDDAYDKACAEQDVVKRNELWKRAQKIVREECPWIFLSFPVSYSLTGNRVEGYIPSAFPYGSEKHLRVKEKK